MWYPRGILTGTLPSAISFLGILNTDTVRLPTAYKAFTLGKNQGSFSWISFHLTHVWVTHMYYSSHLHWECDYFLKFVLNSHSSLCCNLSWNPQTLDLRILRWRSHLSHCAFITIGPTLTKFLKWSRWITFNRVEEQERCILVLLLKDLGLTAQHHLSLKKPPH